MIQFFRISTTYKFGFLVLIFLLLRLPALFYGLPLSNQELRWMLIGENMSEGFLIYTDIWDSIGPASAVVYWLLDLIFGKSRAVYHILSSFLIFGQALLLNDILRRREVYDDITQIPALLYIILGTLFLDYFSLSPMVMANTFLIWLLNLVFGQINEKNRASNFLEIGIFTGVATLFYMPSFIFVAVPLIIFFIYTGSKIQDYLAIFSGFIFVLGMAFLVFYLNNQEYDFYVNYIFVVNYFTPALLLNTFHLLLLLVFPTILAVVAFMSLLRYNRYTNYQTRAQNVMILWIVAGILSLAFTSEVSPTSFLLALTGVVTLGGHYFLIRENAFLKEILFTLLLFFTVFFNHDALYNLRKYYDNRLDSLITIDKMVAKPHEKSDILRNKKILVLGENLGGYQYGSFATPYLNWQIAQRHFNNLNNYDILKSIYENFETNLPEIIIDESNQAEKLFNALPILAQKYERIPETNLYQLKK